MPSKRHELMARWEETKGRDDLGLEEYLKSMTPLFENYKKEYNMELTMENFDIMINTITDTNQDDNVDDSRASAILKPAVDTAEV